MKFPQLKLQLGVVFSVIYFIWVFLFLIFQYFIKGSILEPYYPPMNLAYELSGLGELYWWGTDAYGRSLFEVISISLLHSLKISFCVTLIAFILGILMGYYVSVRRSYLSNILELFSDLIFVFPTILLAIIFMAFSNQSDIGLIAILSISIFPSIMRIVKNECSAILVLDYIQSARALGLNYWQIFYRHVFFNLFPLVIPHIILTLSGVIISESTLGFLGIGSQNESLGLHFSMAKDALLEAPHYAIILSLVLVGIIVTLNLLGDGLRIYLSKDHIKKD